MADADGLIGPPIEPLTHGRSTRHQIPRVRGAVGRAPSHPARRT
jgi:hypothetical protein